MGRAMKDSGVEWIGEIPEEWGVHRLKKNFRIVSGSGFKPELQGNLEGDYPVCKASDISNAGKTLVAASNYITLKTAQENGFSIIPKNSVLFPKIGEAMRKNSRTLCMVDCCADNNCQGLVPINMESRYSYYLLSCIDMTWFDNASTIPCINNQKLGDCNIPYPEIVEQNCIAEFLDTQCAQIDAIIEKTRASIEEYKRLKQAIITQAVTKGVRGDRPMKDSGIEWAGTIPNEWELIKLKYMGYAQNGLTYTPADVCDESEGTLVIRSSNVQNGTLDFNDRVYVNSSIPTDLILKIGDIVICSRNGSKKLVGKSAIVEKDITATYGAFMMVFRSNIRNKKYVYWLLNSDLFNYHLNMYSTVTINQLTGSSLNNMVVPFCTNQAEQTEIAVYLDAKCAEIDALIAQKEQLLTELENYKKSLIYEYVTGKKEVPHEH